MCIEVEQDLTKKASQSDLPKLLRLPRDRYDVGFADHTLTTLVPFQKEKKREKKKRRMKKKLDLCCGFATSGNILKCGSREAGQHFFFLFLFCVVGIVLEFGLNEGVRNMEVMIYS